MKKEASSLIILQNQSKQNKDQTPGPTSPSEKPLAIITNGHVAHLLPCFTQSGIHPEQTTVRLGVQQTDHFPNPKTWKPIFSTSTSTSYKCLSKLQTETAEEMKQPAA